MAMYVPTQVEGHPGLWVITMNGTLTEIKDKVYENKKGTKFQVCLVDVEYPGGAVKPTRASIWCASLDKFEDEFTVGKPVGLQVQVNPGQYQGFAKVQLPGGTVDMALLKDMVDTTEMDAFFDDEEEQSTTGKIKEEITVES